MHGNFSEESCYRQPSREILTRSHKHSATNEGNNMETCASYTDEIRLRDMQVHPDSCMLQIGPLRIDPPAGGRAADLVWIGPLLIFLYTRINEVQPLDPTIGTYTWRASVYSTWVHLMKHRFRSGASVPNGIIFRFFSLGRLWVTQRESGQEQHTGNCGLYRTAVWLCLKMDPTVSSLA